MGLVDMYCKLQSISFSHNKTNLDPSESLFFPAKPAGVHTQKKKRSPSWCNWFALPSGRYSQRTFVVACSATKWLWCWYLTSITYWMPQWYLTTFLCNKMDLDLKSPRCDRVNLCICEVKGARSVIFVKIHISFLFHLKDRHSKDVNFKFHLKQSSNFVYCSCLYLILCKLKGALDKYNTYFYFNREFWIKPILKFSADSAKAFSFY